jgi:hypothetical protein
MEVECFPITARVTVRYDPHTSPITPPDTYPLTSTRLKADKSPGTVMLKREYTDEQPSPILKRDYYAMVKIMENMPDEELKWLERHIRFARNVFLNPVRANLMNKFTVASPEWEIVQKENIPPKSSQVVRTWYSSPSWEIVQKENIPPTKRIVPTLILSTVKIKKSKLIFFTTRRELESVT